jgi:hypothetical protein
MPPQREPKKKQIEVKLERLDSGDSTYDVVYINEEEIVAFNVTNIDGLSLEHSRQQMSDAITNYLTKDQ